MTTTRRRLASLIAFVLPALAIGCGGDGVLLESTPTVIAKVSGDGQFAPAGVALSAPLVVRVSDGFDRPIEGQTVAFTVDAGGGQITPASATTGPDGKASAAWTLGGAAGQQRVQAEVSGDGIPTGLLVNFDATALSGAGAKLVLVSGDNQTAAVGSAVPDSLVVRVTDELDNPVGGVEVTWAVGGGGSVSPTTVATDANGLAAAQRVLGNASGQQTAQASAGSLDPVTFTQTAEPANPTALLLISGDAQSAQAGTTLADPLVVRLVDDNGNGVGGKALTWVTAPGSGSVNPKNVTTSPTGFAQTSWTLGNGTSTNQVSAVFSGLPPVPFTATGTAGAASKLGFIQVPVNTSAGSNITPAVKVAIQDGAGNTVTSATDAVTIGIGTNPSAGTLSGTKTVGAVNGVATFSGLSIDKSGNGYTLTATAAGLTDVTSPSFDIVPGAANRLVFLTGPSDRIVGEKFSPALQVQVQDAGGNPVLIAGPVTIISSVTGTLTGTSTVTPTLGTATFNNLAVNQAGTAYTLTALASGVSSVTSDPFDVAKGATTVGITSKSPAGNSVFGQAVTFNYDINIVSPAVGSLNGSVTVSDGIDDCTGGINAGTGVGSCQIHFSTTGSRNVTAVYSGDQNFTGSTSPAVPYTVNQAVTSLAITSDTPEPSDPGETVNVQWTLSPTGAGAGTPTGTVTISGGAGVTPCTAPAVFGTSSCNLVFPTSGSKTISASYPGDANFAGSSDTEGHTVTTPNQPPTATDDSYSMPEDGTLNVNAGSGVLKNDNDPDNGPQALVARNFSTPAHGNLTTNANGSFTYTPDPDFNSTDGLVTFTYEAFDGAAATSATVTITVTPVNDPPSFTSGGDITVNAADGAFSQPWATGSAGPANESGQTLSYSVSVDAFGSLLFTVPPSISSDGTLSFTPNGFIGVATVTVHVQDDGGGNDTSGDQSFTITIN